VAATLASSLQQYYKTQNYTNGNMHLWNGGTLLWPTYLGLIVAIILFLYDGMILGAYFFGKGAVKRWANNEDGFNSVANIIETTLTTVAAGAMMGTSGNPNSMSYQTCSPSADVTQQAFPQVNLGSNCLMQVLNLMWPAKPLMVDIRAIHDAHSSLACSFRFHEDWLELCRGELPEKAGKI
jgi:hypothetical protein